MDIVNLSLNTRYWLRAGLPSEKLYDSVFGVISEDVDLADERDEIADDLGNEAVDVLSAFERANWTYGADGVLIDLTGGPREGLWEIEADFELHDEVGRSAISGLRDAVVAVGGQF